ncbi:hypothetical protein SGPA1_60307 [Streptomyces misionensis JCM 4497]
MSIPWSSGVVSEKVRIVHRGASDDARAEVPHSHPRPQHGGRPRPYARLRCTRRGHRPQADHRGRELLHRVRAGPHPPPAGRPHRQRGDHRGGRHPARVQHHRRGRRHRHGPRRHALLAALPRPDRGLGGVHGGGPLRRRPDLHLQLRQDHPGHADGRPAPEHPDGLRLRRPHGGRPRHPGRRHRPHPRPDRRHLRGRQRQGLRRRHPAHRGERLPDLRQLFRHVHRQLDELPHRGHRPLPAGQRLGPRHPHRAQAALRRRGPHGHGPHPPLLRAGRRHRPAPQHRHLPGLRERHGPGHRDGRLHQHDPAPAGRRPGGGRPLRPGADRRRLPPRPLPRQGRPQRRQEPHVLHGGRAPGRRHPRPARRAAPGRPAQRGRARRAQPVPRRLAQDLGRARRLPLPRGRRTVARGPRLRPLRRGLLPVRALGDPGRRRRKRLHPFRRARLLQGRRPRGPQGQPGRRRLRGQDGRRRRVDLDLRGPGRGLRVPGGGRPADPHPGGQGGRRRRHPLRGPQGRPRHAGDAVPDVVPEGPRPRQELRADHRRPLLGRHFGPVHRPRLPGGGLRRHHRPRPGRRPHPHRHPEPVDRTAGGRRRTGPPHRGAERHLRPEGPRPQGLRRPARLRRDGDQRRQGRGARREQARLIPATPGRGRLPQGAAPSPSHQADGSRPSSANTEPSGAVPYTCGAARTGAARSAATACEPAPGRAGVCPASRPPRTSTASSRPSPAEKYRYRSPTTGAEPRLTDVSRCHTRLPAPVSTASRPPFTSSR